MSTAINTALSRFERKEYKYVIDSGDYDALRARLYTHLVPDAYSAEDGRYPILSIYYDTVDYRLIAQSMAGSGYKAKLRLRAYGPLSAKAPVFLELKVKYDGISYKRRLPLSYHEAQELVQLGHLPAALPDKHRQVALEIAAFCRRYPLVRTTVITYRRQAWVSPSDSADALRITADSQLATDLVSSDGVEQSTVLLPSNLLILEIKCQGAYPPWLIQALSCLRVYPQSYSKYANAYKLIRQSEALHDSSEFTHAPANLELCRRAHAL